MALFRKETICPSKHRSPEDERITVKVQFAKTVPLFYYIIKYISAQHDEVGEVISTKIKKEPEPKSEQPDAMDVLLGLAKYN